MPPFQTPYVPSRMRETNNTIADLIQRGGAQQAEGIRRGGEISAQMYGNLGQIASGAFQEYQQRKAQLAQEKALAPLREAQTMRAQGEVKQMQQKDRLSDVMANKAAFEAAGNPAMDEESLISNLRQNGLDQFVPDVMKDLAETRKAKEAHVEQTRYTIASVLDRTKKYIGTPLEKDALRMAAQTLKDSGVAGVDDVAGQLMEAPADRVKLIFDNLIGQSPRYLEERTKGQKVVGDALVGPDGVPIYTAPEKPKAPESFSLSPGQMRFGPDGKVIATAPREPEKPRAPEYREINGQTYIMQGTKAVPVSVPGAQVAATSSEAPFVAQPGYQKLPPAAKTAVTSMNNLIQDAKAYRDTLEKLVGATGVNLTGEDAALLNSMHAGLLFTAAKAYEQGALQAPDKAVVEQIFPNPASWSSAVGTLSRGGKAGQMRAIDNLIADFEKRMERTWGLKSSTSSAAPLEMGTKVDSGWMPTAIPGFKIREKK